MITSAEEMATLVESQIQTITDPIILSSLKSFLISPLEQQRTWYEGTDETFLCWLVLKDTKSDTGIVYSDFGFGPKIPWGLVFLSKLIIGDDSGWFQTLERAFEDSFAAGDLKIWNLVKRINGEIVEIVDEGLTIDEAYDKRDKLKLDPSLYSVVHRIFPSN